ncbi:MAG: FecR domain-containing protein [Alphaproteobacteria bacterium]|nr:FecR domain-containing protein [Alphaproteobacteria bacterium]
MSDSDKIVPFPDASAIEMEAARWIARRDSGGMTPDERTAFEAWYARSVQNREAFTRLSETWDAFDVMRARGELRATGLGLSRRAALVAAAAGIAAVALLALAFLILAPNRVDVASYRTEVGEQRTVALVDGSSILLNTDSEVQVRYSPTAREITLVRGEAFFEVAPNRDRPFSVFAGDGVVRAVGTAFAVRLLSDQIEVTVTKGDVALASRAERPHDGIASEAETAKPRQLAMMSAGQSALFKDKIERLGVVAEAELNRKLAWRQGMLAFAGEPLSRVVAEVSRYTDVQIAIEDPTLNDLRVGGYFKVGEVDAMFEALTKSFGVEVDWIDRSHVRLRPAA